MKLFFKHIARTVRRSPMQPVLILLTLVLSVAVCITSFKLSQVFFIRAESMKDESLVLGDITVSAAADREIGILFDDDVKSILGERAEVCGEFSLAAFLDDGDGIDRLISVAATDLEQADRYFKFKYYEYGRFTSENRDSSIIASKRFADENGLKVGDSISFSLLGSDVTYTVEAVAENSGILEQRDALLPMESVIKLLSGHSVFIASLGDSFKPYNRLMIKCAEGQDAEAQAKLLSESPELKNCAVELTKDAHTGNAISVFQTVSVMLLSFLLAVLSVLLIVTAQSLLRKQRSLEYAQFCAAGASGRHMIVMQLGENIAYALVGATAGIFLSPYMLNYTISLFDWHQYNVAVGVDGIALGYLVSLLLSVASTLITVKNDRHTDLAMRLNASNYPTPEKFRIRPVAVFGIMLVTGLLAVVVCDVKNQYIFLFFALISLVLLVYFGSPYVFGRLSELFDRILDKRARGKGVLTLAVKNIKNSYSLCHMGRLLCITFALLVAICASSGIISNQHKVFDGIVQGEILTVNLSDRSLSKLKKNESIAGIASFNYDDAVTINGERSAMAVYLSGDTNVCVSDDFAPEVMPKGKEVAISHGLAKLMDLDVGDKVKVNIRGGEHEVTVSHIWKINAGILCMDDSYVAGSERMHCVKLAEGVGVGSEEYKNIVASLEADGVRLLDESEIGGAVMDTISGFNSLLKCVIFIAVVLATIGFVNVFAESLGSRRRERELLVQCGAEKRRVIMLHVIEIMFVTLIALFIGALSGAVICLLLNSALHSFGYTMFYI